MLFNALRIGFIVAPERLVEAFKIARSFVDRHAPTLDQAILTEFINEGHFGHHVRKMRQVYSDRSQLLTEEANRRLSGLLDVVHAQSGMRTVAWIKTRVPEMVLTRRAERLGLEVVPISSCRFWKLYSLDKSVPTDAPNVLPFHLLQVLCKVLFQQNSA